MGAVVLRLVVALVMIGGIPAPASIVGTTSVSDTPDCADESDFCASFPDDTVGVSDWPYRANLTVTGDVSAVEITAESLNASQLADIFGGERTADGVRIQIGEARRTSEGSGGDTPRDGESATIPAEFDYTGGGNYTFHVRAVDANRTANAHLHLTVAQAPTVHLVPEFVTVERDGTAEIGLDFEDAAVGNVTVAGEEFELTAKVVDADGDERVTLLVDFGAIETNAEAVAVAAGDRLRSATVSGANRTNLTGQHEIRAGLDGEATDLGRLQVVPETQTTTGTATTTGIATTTSEATTTMRTTVSTTKAAGTTGSTPEATTATESTMEVTVGETSKKASQIARTTGLDDESPSAGVPGFGVVSALTAITLALAGRRS